MLGSSDIQAASVNGVPLCLVKLNQLLCQRFHGSPKFVGTFQVAVNISVPVILEKDFLLQQKCKIYFFLGHLGIYERILGCTGPSATTLNGPNGCSVYAVKMTLLPQGSESLVFCLPISHPVLTQTSPTLLESTNCNSFIRLIGPLQNHNEMY